MEDSHLWRRGIVLGWFEAVGREKIWNTLTPLQGPASHHMDLISRQQEAEVYHRENGKGKLKVESQSITMHCLALL